MTRRTVSWLAGAALFMFLWYLGGTFLGNELASYVFPPIAAVLIARQYLRHRRVSLCFRTLELPCAGGRRSSSPT